MKLVLMRVVMIMSWAAMCLMLAQSMLSDDACVDTDAFDAAVG